MTVRRSKRRSYFLPLVFITKSDIATSFTILLVMYACVALSEVIEFVKYCYILRFGTESI